MDEQSIETAYAPFVTALRQGGFEAPAQGWPAEQVAAHVICNNDLIAEAAEAIVSGGSPSYDNHGAVDDAELSAYAESVGGLSGLADALERSAQRLALAWSALDETSGAQEMPVMIVHEGAVVVDGPMAIRQLIEGNASFHLDMHLEQLLALRS